MELYHIGFLGMSEHNIAMSNPQWRQKIYEAIHGARSGRIVSQFSSGPEFDARGRLMGGTGIVAMNEITGRLEPDGKSGDPMGRWSLMHFRRSQSRPLTVISIYQVCPTPTNSIGDISWHQQRRYLDLTNRSEHPRQAFIKDLIDMVQPLQEKGHSVIIGGDWNDWLSAKRSQLVHLCTKLNLTDPWAHQHPHNLDFATYENGQHRIDSVLISHDLVPSLKSVRYSPGGLLCATDHRAILVDFNTNMLFGSIMPCTPGRAPTQVRSKDKKSVTAFIEGMHRHLSSHNAFARGKALEAKLPADISLVEHLDQLLGEAGNAGERRCCRRRQTWFSSDLATMRHTVTTLRYYVNGLKVKIDRSRVIHQRLQALHQQIILPTTLCDAQCLLPEYEQKLADIIKASEKIRHQELESRSKLSSARDRPILQRISHGERNSQTWKTLAFMSNRNAAQHLHRLDIPASWPSVEDLSSHTSALEDPKTTQAWRTVSDPSEIQQYLLVRNCQHFGQAHGTPFTIPPLSTDIDWGATSSASHQILMGEYSPAHPLSTLCQLLLAHCRSPIPNLGIKSSITAKEFEGKIRAWKETTTTSPSGRHLGRYKALFSASIYPPTSNEALAFIEKQHDIMHLMLHIINYCITTGYPLTRWCNVTNTMIFKEMGAYKIHKLRVIHLFVADLNMIYSVKWRNLVHYAEKHNLINPGQYGGRPGYEATSLAFLEEMRFDISYATRQALAIFDNDAASCYDRMIPNLVSLTNRTFGLPEALTRLHGRLLQSTKYHIMTPAGLSETSYSHSVNRPLYGTGQGAGNSPTIWLLTSSLLFDVFDQASHGAVFQSPDGTCLTQLGISGFVDDTNTVANSCHPQHDQNINELLESLQHDAQLWCNLLFLSGGKLELSKCTYHVLRFNFKPDGTPIPIANDNLAPLQIKDPSTNENHLIPFLPSTQAHKILGHWKAPVDPRQITQLKAIVQKATRQALLIVTSLISRQGAYLAYNSKYTASLRYVLPQCWFTPKQLSNSEKSSMSRIFSKCGFARTTPHALLYTPVSLAGGGFLHWLTIQGEGQVKHFIKHWRTNTTESRMLRINVSWTQWQAGIGESILRDVETPLPHLESRWLPSMRQFLSSIHGWLDLDNAYIPAGEQVGDLHIMDLVLQSGEFTCEEIRLVNYCRLYLHVSTISELFNAAGTTLLPHMFECQRPPWFNTRTCTTLQQRPSRYPEASTVGKEAYQDGLA